MEGQGWMLFFAVEVLILGALFFVLPRIGRRGLLFGVYVGEERCDSEDAARVRRTWYVWMGVSILASLGFVVAAGLLAPTAVPLAIWVIIGAFVGSYLRAHFAARRLAVVSEAPAVAVLEDTPFPTSVLPMLTMVLGLAVGAGLVGYTLMHYDAMPDRVPIHFDIAGEPDGWTDRSLVPLLILPVLAGVMGFFLGFFALLTLRAKRSLRHTDDPATARAQGRFRLAVSRFLCGVALLMIGMFAVLGLGSVDAARGVQRSMGWATLGFTLTIVVFCIGGAIYLMVRYGQGGANLESSVANAALTDGLADNRHWWLGAIYVNREDPSIMVEKRFGLGYTINFGNPKAVVIFVGFLVILFGIVAVAIATA